MDGIEGFVKALIAWINGKSIEVKTGNFTSIYTREDRKEYLSEDGHAIDFSAHDIENGEWHILD